MKTAVCEMFGLDVPIFAFSHCRDVVAEVSKAGGMGVLGAANFTPEQLALELQWLDAHTDGKPYGIDLLIPNTHQDVGEQKLDIDRLVPAMHRQFVKQLADEAGLPPLPDAQGDELIRERASEINMTPREAQALLDVALRHPIKLVVNGLGTPPREVVQSLQARGIRVGSLIGSLAHAQAQLDAGVDLLVAQGSEAGGHTGSITSMVLWPQVIDMAGEVPVLAAGGIGRGKQMAAALVMGAAGVWCGSIWLGTRESELTDDLKDLFFAADSSDAVRTRAITGKPCRALRSRYTEAWEQPGAPKPLPMPLQTLLWLEPNMRAQRAHAKEWLTYPVGQIVGDMREQTATRDVVRGMLEEFVDAVDRLNGTLG